MASGDNQGPEAHNGRERLAGLLNHDKLEDKAGQGRLHPENSLHHPENSRPPVKKGHTQRLKGRLHRL
jgi:hypothetical protein